MTEIQNTAAFPAGSEWRRTPLSDELNVPVPTVAELERDCVDAYALFVAARRRLTAAEIAHDTAIKARRP